MRRAARAPQLSVSPPWWVTSSTSSTRRGAIPRRLERALDVASTRRGLERGLRSSRAPAPQQLAAKRQLELRGDRARHKLGPDRTLDGGASPCARAPTSPPRPPSAEVRRAPQRSRAARATPSRLETSPPAAHRRARPSKRNAVRSSSNAGGSVAHISQLGSLEGAPGRQHTAQRGCSALGSRSRHSRCSAAPKRPHATQRCGSSASAAAARSSRSVVPSVAIAAPRPRGRPRGDRRRAYTQQ